MCDWSVVAENQRDVVDGENLVITQLGHHTKGTTSPGDPKTAVCLRPGIAVVFSDLPESIREHLGLAGGANSAIFVQLPREVRGHRDAFTFANGRTILVNGLPVGLSLKTLPAAQEKGATRQQPRLTAPLSV